MAQQCGGETNKKVARPAVLGRCAWMAQCGGETAVARPLFGDMWAWGSARGVIFPHFFF